MTYEEALKTLDETFIGNLELKIVLSNALEKQIPKKPDLDGGIYCPCCLHEFKENYDTTSYCPNCGQAIDWSDTE
jgi:hypothetical protein